MSETPKHLTFAKGVAEAVNEIEQQTGKDVQSISITPNNGPGRKDEFFGTVTFYPKSPEDKAAPKPGVTSANGK